MPRSSPFDGRPPLEKFLYHYTSADTALTKIIPTGKLRAGSLKTMNDPRESKDWLFGMNLRTVVDEEAALNDAVAASKLAQACTRVISFATDADAEGCVHPECQFGRGFAHSAMWNHYARQHTGACLIFDREKLEAAVSKGLGAIGDSIRTGWIFFDSVEYGDRDRTFDMSSANPFILDPMDSNGDLRRLVLAHVARVRKELIFRKGLDWAYEREYRIAVWDDGEDAMMLDIGDSLVGVVVTEDYGLAAGAEGPGKVAQVGMLQDTSRRHRIPARVLYWDNGVPKLGELKRKWP